MIYSPDRPFMQKYKFIKCLQKDTACIKDSFEVDYLSVQIMLYAFWKLLYMFSRMSKTDKQTYKKMNKKGVKIKKKMKILQKAKEMCSGNMSTS